MRGEKNAGFHHIFKGGKGNKDLRERGKKLVTATKGREPKETFSRRGEKENELRRPDQRGENHETG